MTVESIFNYRKINERIATAGQPTEAQFEATRDAGFSTVINLAPHDASSGALADEAATLKGLGLNYVHIPVAWDNPTQEDYEKFCQAMQRLGTEKVFIHCAANFRVTAFYARYAVEFEGRPASDFAELVTSVWESRPDYRMDATWKAFLAGRDKQPGN